MKTDKELFLNMLQNAGIIHTINKNDVYVENSSGMGYSGFSSCWIFDQDGKLESVGHYET